MGEPRASFPPAPCGLAQHCKASVWAASWAPVVRGCLTSAPVDLSDLWPPLSPTGPCICALGSSAAVPTMEGPLRRKTLLKEGRKPTVSQTPLSGGCSGVWLSEGPAPETLGVPRRGGSCFCICELR